MKNKTRMMVLISILLTVSMSCQMLTDLLPSGSTNPSNFTAAATSPISVQLTWSSVEGAQKYLIERNDRQTDYSPVGEVSGETTSFEDFLVPPNTQISYRIKTVTASGTSGGKTVSLTTPEEFPNPLTVAATFDTQNAQSQAIGAEGGKVSISDSRGARYTLDVPAGALDSEVTFTLTPIQDIQGLPLSGGMTSGVQIEPEGLTFNQSATLSIETTKSDTADKMISMAFAFDGSGSEFHFVPGSSAAGTSAFIKVVRPAIVGSWNVINVPQTKSYGNGKGTSKDIRNQVKNHAPTSPADNLDQKVATSAEDVQARVSMARSFGGLLAGDAQQITDWESFNETLSTFRQYVNIVELDNELQTDQINEIIDSTWDELTTKGHDLLDKAVADCKKSPNLADAKKLVNRLIDGLRFGLPFSQKFAEKFNQKYGADALKNIKTKLDKCNLGYKAYWEDQGAEWSGVVCSLDQPFTINVVSSGGDLVMPFKFSPTTDQVGTVSFDVTKYDTHWEGNGPYAVKGTDPEKLSLVGTIVGSYTTKSGNGFYPVHFDIPLTPLDTKECSQP